MLAGGCEPQHSKPEDATQLRHGQPHATRGGMHEDQLAGSGGDDADEHVMGSEIDDGERGTLLEAPSLRQREDERGGNHDELALAPELGHRDDTVPDPRRGDAAPHGVHDARNFVADDARRPGRVGVEALPSQQIGEVDARRLDPDAHRAWGDRWIGRLAHGEHFRRAVPGNHQLLQLQASVLGALY